MLVGRADVSDPIPDETQRGSVRVILRGAGDISDACPDAGERAFVAEYDGELVLSSDRTFEARLVPFDPPVATPSGCTITRVVVERIDEVAIEAAIPSLGLQGRGSLDFQTLSTVDNDDLQSGELGELRATLLFEAVAP